MPATVALPKLSYTLPEAQDATGFTEKQLRAAIAKGELKAKRAARSSKDSGEGAGKFIVLAADLQAFLEGLADA